MPSATEARIGRSIIGGRDAAAASRARDRRCPARGRPARLKPGARPVAPWPEGSRVESVAVLVGLLGVLLVSAASPGPSFVLVARTAVARSRRDGLAAAFGMGAGAAVFAALVLLGLTAVLARVPTLYAGLKLLGGMWLLLLAWRMWRGAAAPLALVGEGTGGRDAAAAFRAGLATQLTNPKTAVYYGSVFAALLPRHPPGWLVLALPPLVLMVEAGWYALVAIVFSAGRPRAAYLRAKPWVDRAAGAVMGLLGTRLALEAVRAR